MSKKILVSLMLTIALGAPSAFAHGFQQQPSLLGGLLSLGQRGSIANVAASVGQPGNSHYGSGSSSLLGINANVLNGAVRANVDVGQQSRHGNTLLGISATVLDGGVGNRRDHW